MGQSSETRKQMPDTGQIAAMEEGERLIALAGDPGGEKSAVFQQLTGGKQRTGNWPERELSAASGRYYYKYNDYIVVDLPGTYSLISGSVQEEIARDFICFGDAEAVVVVCDATCLEKNLNLVLQTAEITPNLVVCVNRMDEARKKQVRIDLEQLSNRLGVPVLSGTGRGAKGLNRILEGVHLLVTSAVEGRPVPVRYARPIEEAAAILEPEIRAELGGRLNARFLALRLLEGDAGFLHSLENYLDYNILESARIHEAVRRAKALLRRSGIDEARYREEVVFALDAAAQKLGAQCVTRGVQESKKRGWKAFLSKKVVIALIVILVIGGAVWLICAVFSQSAMVWQTPDWYGQTVSQGMPAADGLSGAPQSADPFCAGAWGGR
ncbi:MAG: 50S ribosome-binding GTPase [Clostridiales bacterium]|nr:50S ribosome-binding GTPase [Clostridiales bacterium]